MYRWLLLTGLLTLLLSWDDSDVSVPVAKLQHSVVASDVFGAEITDTQNSDEESGNGLIHSVASLPVVAVSSSRIDHYCSTPCLASRTAQQIRAPPSTFLA